MMNIVAFDLGASNGRALLGRFDGSRLTIEEIHRFPNQIVSVRGHFHWDALRLFSEMQAGLAKAIAVAPIASMAIDTWGVDGCFIGRNDRVLGFPCAYRDFSGKNMDQCKRKLGAEFIYQSTGIQFWPFNTLFQFYWHKKNRSPELKAAERFLFSPDFYRFLFTGQSHTEWSIASTSQMADARTRKWCPALFDALKIPVDIMGDIIEPPMKCGVVENTSIAAIAVAGHDTGSAVVSVPAAPGSDDWAWLSSGTWSIIGIETRTPIISDESFARNFSNEGGVFGTTRVLTNVMGMWLSQECIRVWKAHGEDHSYAELDRKVREAPANGPVINVNDLRFYTPEDMPAEIQKACKESGQKAPRTPGEIQRCIIESLAKKYAEVLGQLVELRGKPFARLHMVGGGIQNELLNQMTADACNVKVEAGPVEGTAIGNMVMQLIAGGEVKDLDEGRALVKASFPTTVYQPR